MNAVMGKGYRPQNPYIHSQQQELSANQAGTPNTNPLRPYTKIVEIMNHQEMKEEAQQVNFDDLSLGTAAQMSTPSDNILAGGQVLHRGSSEKQRSQPYKNYQEHRGLNTSQEQYEYSTQYQSQPNRSQTATSHYIVQSRNPQMGVSSSSANNYLQQQMLMRNTATDFTKVKMTRSVYRQHQQKIFQEVGVSFNVRPLTRQSGMGKLVLRHGALRNSTSDYHSESNGKRILITQAGQHQQFAKIIKNSRNTGGAPHKTATDQLRVTQQASLKNTSTLSQAHQSVKKGKDGCYISFQTNVDNTQAIIPMILSNEDLLGTNTEDVLNVTGSSSEDLKKTILTKQVNNTRITVDNKAIPREMSCTRNTWTKLQTQRNGNHQIFQNIYQNTSSEDQTNPASRRAALNANLSDMQMTETSFINIVPNYATSGRANTSMLRGETSDSIQRSRNPQFARRQGKSQQQASRAGTQMAQGPNASNNFQPIQQIKCFGFQSIPDFKEFKIRVLQDQQIKNLSKQSQAEGRMADVNEYSFTTGTSFYHQQQPLFLSSTKKAPGLQKECAGSYANVINSRTCLGQKNVFKFSMDLPLKLKQQMWLQHQQEKEQLAAEFQQSDHLNNSLNKVQAQTSTANLNVQHTLQIVGKTSRLHLDKSMGVIQSNHFGSGTHINLEPNIWSQSHRESLNPGVVTAELSKQEIISPYRDSKAQDKINESNKYGISQVKLIGMIESGTSSHEISSDNLSQASKLKRPQVQVESLMQSPSNKRSKIIYSINKSTRNKNSPIRSRNFLHLNESQAQLKKSKDSKCSKKSTLSKHLGSHYVDQNILDSALLSSIGGAMPEILPPYQNDGKDGFEAPIIRSQESSFHASRKRPPRRSDFTNDDLNGSTYLVHVDNPAGHDFNMTQISIKVDSKRSNTIGGTNSLKKSNSKFARHGSASTVGQNQARQREDGLASQLKIQRVQKNEGMDFLQRNQSHIRQQEGPSIESVRQQEMSQPQANYESVRAKMVESRTQQLRLRSKSSRSLHDIYQPHAQKVLTLIASLHGSLLPTDHVDEPPIIQAFKVQQPLANNVQEVQNEVKRQDSAFTQGSEGASSSFEALHLQLIKRDPPPIQRQDDIQEVPINQTITLDVQQEVSDELPSRKSFKQVLSKHHARANLNDTGAFLDSSPSFQRMQTEQVIFLYPSKQPPLLENHDLQDGGSPHMRPSTSQNNLMHGGSMVSIVVGQVDITSPQLIQQQIDEAVFGNQHQSASPPHEGAGGKSDTLIINDEEDNIRKIREAPKTEAKVTLDNGLDQNKLSVSQYKDSSIMDEGDRYQMQAAILEKVVVKSPGRQTTDHVKIGGAPQPFSLSTLLNEVPITLHLQKKSSVHRRPSNRGRRLSQDLLDVTAASDRISQSPKRTVLIKKSRGVNEIQELIVQQNQVASEIPAAKIDSNLVKTKPFSIMKRGLLVHPTQMFSLDELENEDFLNIQNSSNSALPISDPRRDMPRHGTAAPSVIRRNKETMRRKKGSQPTQQRQSNSQEPLKLSSKDILAATFHVMPVVTTQKKNDGEQPSNTRKSKTPNGQTVYQHTSKMQTLVIHQSELAIDSSQQKMQLQLIQAYHEHQNRMQSLNPDIPLQGLDQIQKIGVLRVVPVILQNQARLTQQQQPSNQVVVTGVPKTRILDSFDDVSSLAALHKIIEETKSKDSSNNNTVLIAPPHVGDSTSLSKINGWRESKDQGITLSDQNSISENPILRDSIGSRSLAQANPKSIKERRNSRNRNLHSLLQPKTSQRSQIASKRLNEEPVLAIVGKNMKN